MSTWPTVRLKDLATIRRGLAPQYVDRDGLLVINQRCIRDGGIIDFTECKLTNKLQSINPDKVIRQHDILINSTGEGTLGRSAQILNIDGPMTVDSHVTILRIEKKDKVNPRFMSFVIRSRQQELTLMARGSTGQTDLPRDALLSLSLLLPPLPEQDTIANILGSLEDKIQANRRISESLEATARTIFKSWFVDFDPVHFKSRGEQPPGMDAETAALFPDRFEESNLGLIPYGWKVVLIGDHVRATKGLSYKGEHLVDNFEDGVPMHNLNSINEWGTYKFDGIKFYSGDYQTRHEIKPGDLIVANTEQGFNLLLIASPAIVPSIFGERGIFSHHVYKVEIKQKSPLNLIFIYYRIMLSPFRDLLQGYTNGTTVNMLPLDAFEKPQFVMPSADLMQRFEQIVAPILQQIEKKQEESRRLVDARNVLLPKLVSGEVRVEAAGEFRGDAT
ncbi:MAG: restriction endonuclease subunit S [Anaerolineae bacterium]